MTKTHIGAVTLAVSDVPRLTDFYTQRIGLTIQREDADGVTLGAGDRDLVTLKAAPGSRRVRGTTGLYHFAILVPSRLELARALRNLAETRTPLHGFADHLVSEAIYLADPEGNGIEIYRDRPRTEWPYEDGHIVMATDPIDLDGIMAELQHDGAPWTGMHPDTTLGHMHLHVASIPETEAFYCGLLGFDVIMNMGSALFISKDGYHHHIGLNTWVGVGAPPPPADAQGLREYQIYLPDGQTLEATTDRLQAAGVAVEQRDDGVFVRDPSQNGIVLMSAAH